MHSRIQTCELDSAVSSIPSNGMELDRASAQSKGSNTWCGGPRADTTPLAITTPPEHVLVSCASVRNVLPHKGHSLPPHKGHSLPPLPRLRANSVGSADEVITWHERAAKQGYGSSMARAWAACACAHARARAGWLAGWLAAC